MKKFIAIILMVCYSVSSLGLSVNFFYCCGNFKSVSITNQHQSCSKPDIKPQKSSCCKSKKSSVLPPGGKIFKKNCYENKQLSFNLHIDQKDQQNASLNLLSKTFTLHPLSLYPRQDTIFNLPQIAATYKSPPQAVHQEKNIFICVFRI